MKIGGKGWREEGRKETKRTSLAINNVEASR